ncbi:MAG: hypothetical protein DGJ47_000040 [Rickettsiaceae bacterium]
MHAKKRNRLLTIIFILLLSSSGVYIILQNLRDNIVYFYPPSEIEKAGYNSMKIRVGGVVKAGSIAKIDGNSIEFIITDEIKEIKVQYNGMLPALFRPGQGIIAEGSLVSSELFLAQKLLAKHDENYRPPAVITKELVK